MPPQKIDALRLILRHGGSHSKVISTCTEFELTDVDFGGILNIFKQKTDVFCFKLVTYCCCCYALLLKLHFGSVIGGCWISQVFPLPVRTPEMCTSIDNT